MPEGLIAGIGLTHLTVYDQRPGPDGVHSGCPHVHAVTDEAYYVLAGTGAIDLHDAAHGFRSVPLAPGSYVQFTPGTLHRAVNQGGLTVLAVMGNAGLAERGDARVWFGPEVDADPAAYERLWRLPAKKGLEGALERRDRAVVAYLELLRLWREDCAAYAAELARFVDLHAREMAARRETFAHVVEDGPAGWLAAVTARLDGLPAGPADSDAAAVDAADEAPKLGMCGLLRPLDHRHSV